MLEQVILRKSYLLKHLEAPLLREREEYLELLHGKELSRLYLLSVADYMLRIVQLLNLKDRESHKVTLSSIETAANKWANMVLNHPMKRTVSPSSKEKFICIAIEWLKYIGRLEPMYEDTNNLINAMFLRRFAKRKYLSAPFLHERLSHLSLWQSQGATVPLLRLIAAYQLHIIHYLHLTKLRIVTTEELREASHAWSTEAGIHRRKQNYSFLAGRRFLHFSKDWLSYLGLWREEKEIIVFSDYLDQYLAWMSDEKGYAAATIAGHYSNLKIFLNEIGTRCKTLMEMNPSVIDAVLKKRHDEDKCSRRTLSTVASTYRNFLQYAEAQGWCKTGLSMSIKAARVYHLDTLPSSPPWENIQKLIESKDTDAPADIRDYAMLLLLTVYGLRCSEVTGMKLKDIDWRNEQLLLRRAKNCRPQVFPLLPAVGTAILRYITEVRQNASRLEYIFLCMRSPYRPMSTSNIYRLVSAGLKAQHIELKHYGPHSLRHGCATRLINTGFSLKEVADQLGHQQLDTTRIYAKIDLTNLRKVADINWEDLL